MLIHLRFLGYLRQVQTLGLLLLVFVFLSACSQKEKQDNSVENPSASQTSITKVYSDTRGPHGERAVSLDEFYQSLKNLDPQKVAQKNYTVAIAMHDEKNDWSQALINGMRSVFQKYGVQVLALTDGQFDTEKQIADIANLVSLDPDILITLPLDAEKVAPVLKTATQKGIPQIFIDAIPKGFSPEQDYVSFAVGDAYQMGRLGSQYLVKSLNFEKGKNKNTTTPEIALLTWKSQMFTVDQRSAGAKDFLVQQEIPFVEYSFAEFHEIQALTDQLLDSNASIRGIWTVWDAPGFEVIKSIRKNKKDIKVVTCDLSKKVVEELQKDILIASAVDHPFDQGRAEAYLAIASLMKMNVPSYLVVYSELATKDNYSQVWKRMYHQKYMP